MTAHKKTPKQIQILFYIYITGLCLIVVTVVIVMEFKKNRIFLFLAEF